MYYSFSSSSHLLFDPIILLLMCNIKFLYSTYIKIVMYFVISSIVSIMWALKMKTLNLLFMIEILLLNASSHIVSETMVNSNLTHVIVDVHILWRQGNICQLNFTCFFTMQDIQPSNYYIVKSIWCI